MEEPEREQTTKQDLIEAEIVNLSGAEIGTVEAEMVRIHRGGARRIIAGDVGLRTGGAGVITAETAGMSFSGALAVRGDVVSVENSGAGVVIGDKVRLSGSRTGMTIARRAELGEGSSTIFLLARERSRAHSSRLRYTGVAGCWPGGRARSGNTAVHRPPLSAVKSTLSHWLENHCE